jgi:hypothetical protein
LSKVLFVTPRLGRREGDPWFQPVRDAHEKVQGIDRRLISHDPENLAGFYQEAFVTGLMEGFDYVLIVEDDEEPTPDIALRFLEVTKKYPSEGVFAGVKRLRQGPVYIPYVWIFKGVNNPPAINELPVKVQQTHPNQSGPFPVIGGILCSPLMYSPTWLERQGIRFHGMNLLGPKDTMVWDSALSNDLWERRLRFIACPTIHVRHWDEKTREVYA